MKTLVNYNLATGKGEIVTRTGNNIITRHFHSDRWSTTLSKLDRISLGKDISSFSPSMLGIIKSLDNNPGGMYLGDVNDAPAVFIDTANRITMPKDY